MKTFAALSTALLFFVLSACVPQLCAQEHEDERNGAKSVPEQNNRRPAEATPQQDHDRDHSATHEPRSDQERENQSRRPQQQRSREPETARPEQNQQTQAQHEERRPAQAERGRRIPDDRFRAQFGPSHHFRVRREQIINNPQPVVVYGGYTFELLDPWPAEWSYDDDCYIDYVDDQYYLFDPFHPGIRVALIVVDTD